MFKITCILIFSLLLGLVPCNESPDMIVVLSRHGAREPLILDYDNSWENPTFLMDVGIEQHFTLGTVLGRKYAKLIENINPNQIYLQSTYASRTHESVSAELLGMFYDRSHKHQLANQGKKDLKIPYADEELVNQVVDELLENPETIPNRLQFLPQTTHTVYDEDLLNVTPVNCKYVEKSQAKRFGDEINQAIETYLQDTIQKVKNLGYAVKDLFELMRFGDTLSSRFIDSKPPLKDIPYESKLYKDAVFAFQWWNIYNVMGSDFDRSLKVFPLYSRLIKWFSDKAEGVEPIKLVLLGGHESTMFPFLSLYNITNQTCFAENYKSEEAGKPLPFPDCQFPEMASQFVYEFYKNSGKPFIRMLYNGKPVKICRDSQGVDCTLDQFIKELPQVTHDLNPKKFAQVCTPDLVQSRSGLLIFSMILLGIILGLTMYHFLAKRVGNSHQYAKQINISAEPESGKPIQVQMSEKNPSHTNDNIVDFE